MASGLQPERDRLSSDPLLSDRLLSDRLLSDRIDDGLLQIENWIQRRRLSLGFVALAIVSGCLGWWLVTPSGSAVAIDELIPTVEEAPIGPPSSPVTLAVSLDPADEPAATEGSLVVIHVVGAVAEPGVVEVPEGSRVADAVTAAGGVQSDARIDLLNLAEPVSDGMQIRVPSDSDLESSSSSGSPWPLVRRPSASTTEGSAPPGGAPVDINKAQADELERLPGVGPSIASAIVAWRDENGPFVMVDDLERVPGIGPAKLAGLRDQATV